MISIKWWHCGVRTVGDLVGLSPLLVDEDDGHQDDDLGHDAEEGPEGGQPAADAQVDLVAVGAQLVGPGADVVADVVLDAQVVDGQRGLVGGALDLVFVGGAVDDGLRVVSEGDEYIILTLLLPSNKLTSFTREVSWTPAI